MLKGSKNKNKFGEINISDSNFLSSSFGKERCWLCIRYTMDCPPVLVRGGNPRASDNRCCCCCCSTIVVCECVLQLLLLSLLSSLLLLLNSLSLLLLLLLMLLELSVVQLMCCCCCCCCCCKWCYNYSLCVSVVQLLPMLL